jgi:hypothetical protein
VTEVPTTGDSTAETNARSARRRSRWSKVLAVVGAVLLPIAGLTFWSRNQLLNTDRYVQTVKPLASDPAIQAAVSDRVADAVSNAVDFEHRAEDALPDRAKFLAAPIAAAGRNLVHEVATTVITSEEFQRLWVEVNRLAHEQIDSIITGSDTETVRRSDGEVVISLRPVAERVLQRLDEVVPVDLTSVDATRLNTEFVLVNSEDLGRVQSAVKWFDRLTYFLVVLAIVALVGSVLVEKDRRRGIQRVGLAITISMAVMLLAYSIGREYYVSHLPAEIRNPDAATAIFDIITRYVDRGIRALLVLGLVLFVGAWLVGPSRNAVRVRGWWEKVRARGSAEIAGEEPGALSTWVAAHANELRFAIVGIAVVALVLWDRPTGRVVLLLTILTALALGVIAVLAGAARTTTDVS